MILLGAILSGAEFNMLLIIFLLGIPLIIMLILTFENKDKKVLLTQSYKQ